MQRIPAADVFSAREVCRILFRHKGKTAAAFLLVFGAAVLYTALSPEIYQSETLLFVRLGRENIGLDPTTTLGQAPSVAIPNSRENEINSVVEILESRAQAEQVVDALGTDMILAGEQATSEKASTWSLQPVKEWLKSMLGVGQPLTPRERAISEVAQNLSAHAIKKTDIVSITYRAKSPQLAQKVVACCAKLYLEQHVKLNRTPGAHEFLVTQTERVRDALSQTEESLKNLKNESGLAAPETQREMLVARAGRLEDELMAAEAAAASTRSEVETLQRKLEGLEQIQVTSRTSGLDNNAADGMRQALYNLQLQEKDMSAKYTELHPELVRVREQIAQAQVVLKQESETRSTTTEGPSRAYEETRLALLRQEPILASLQAKADVLREQLVALRGELQLHTENELRVAQLEREFELQDAAYRQHVDNLQGARIDHALEAERISNINIAQEASLSERPVRPRVLLNLAAGLMGGILAGLALAFTAENLDHSLKTPEEIERMLDLPALVSIPRLPPEQRVFNGKRV